MPNNNNKNKAQNKKKPSRTRVRRSRRITSMLDFRASQYRALLLDPCNGPLVPPVAMGPTSGLLFRQRRVIDLAFSNATTGSINATTPLNLFACYQPSLGRVVYGIGSSGNAADNTAEVVSTSLETGILSSTSGIAQSYRPVAGCIKFIPTGPIGHRMGVLASGYVADQVATPATGYSKGTALDSFIDNYLTICNKTISNGSGNEMSEVRWLPADPAELDFREKDAAYAFDASTCMIVGRNVDGNHLTTAVGTAFRCYGYFEVTTVFEWIPRYNSSIVTSVQAGSTSTLQQVLGTMGDLAKAATESSYARALLRAAGETAAGMGMSYMGHVANVMLNQRTPPGLLLG